jgi:large subunit ribosomal protein L21
MSYAIISVGGKQYRVAEGEKLLVDRVRADEGATFTPPILMLGGDGDPQFAPDGVTVTARVVQHVLGDKIRIGKYKAKKGYKRHAGHRSHLSQIQIESIGKVSRAAKPKKATAEPSDSETTSARSKPKASASRKEEG